MQITSQPQELWQPKQDENMPYTLLITILLQRFDFFFKEWDEREPGQSLRAFTAQCTPSRSTAARWLEERDNIGSPAGRKARRGSTRLSECSKISRETCKMLVSPTRNSVRTNRILQSACYGQLTRKLKASKNVSQRYKRAYVNKVLKPATKEKREKYGQIYKDKTINDFWQYIVFTDEAHIDPSQ